MISLIHGDCLEEMPKIKDGSIDMVLCDPPYGITACKWDSVIPLAPMWQELKRLIKPSGAIVMTSSQPFTTTLIHSNMKMFRYCWVWVKSNSVGHLNAYKMPMKNIEDIAVFYEKPPSYFPQLREKKAENIRPPTTKRKKSSCYGKHDKQSERKIPDNKTLPNQVLRFNSCQENLHPTQKPVALMEYLIKTYTNKGDVILDFAAGSLTTGIACVNLGRSFIGIEKDEEYYKTGKERINKAWTHAK